MADTTPEPMSYIARCRICGGIACAVVDVPNHQKRTAELVADAIRDGYAVERVETPWVRANWQACHCDEQTTSDQQLPLME